jgi:RES domain
MPPAWLAKTSLPLDLVPAGTPLFRVHRIGRGPIFFGPGKGVAPTYRFDSLTGQFGVLYVGCSLAAAAVETLLRNPGRRMVRYPDIADRALCQLTCARDLKVVRLHGTGLQAVGCDNAISTGPYGVCGAWSNALWAHSDRPDGIAYQSRHDSGEICLALFEREDLQLQASELVPLIEELPRIAALLSTYGKSIVDVPI